MYTLQATTIRLEPLHASHHDGLASAADDARIWPYMPQAGAGFDFARWLDDAFAAHQSGTQQVFTVVLQADDRIVGSSRLYDIVPQHKRVQIGNTWYHPSVWGTAVNPECKLLMLRHAFTTMGVHRVGFSVDARNARSLAAMRKLGAVEEGTLRRHMIAQDGFVRDTVAFSITEEEWPTIKVQLQARLQRFQNAF